MTTREYRETYSWQGAIELGPKLLRLAEELPASEDHGLAYVLRELVVELPAMIAEDLINATPARLLPMLKLTAALELIDRVYPALDALAATESADKLMGMISSDKFDQKVAPTPAPAPELSDTEITMTPAPEAPDVEAPEPAAQSEPEPAPAEPEPVKPPPAPAPPAPTSVSIIAEPAAAEVPAPAEEENVHPDSVQ